MEKKYYKVTYQHSESVYCSNIAHAESVEAVEAHYSKYNWCSVSECEAWELESAQRRGMPIVEIETAQPEETAQQAAEAGQTGSALYLRKMGCNFRPGEHERSDIGNYRVRTLDGCIPGKDGRMYFLEFGLWHNRTTYRTTNKRTGKPLKNPIPEIINPAALHLDTEYTDESGISWRNCKLEADIHAQNYSYTKADILTVVNEISTAEYSTVKFVDYFEFVQEAGKNFTPSAAICKWAKAHKLPTENTLDGIRVKLYTGEYKYMAYHVHSQADGNEKVTVILEEV